MSASKDYFENLTAAQLFGRGGTGFIRDPKTGQLRAVDIVPPEHQEAYKACQTEEERADFMERMCK